MMDCRLAPLLLVASLATRALPAQTAASTSPCTATTMDHASMGTMDHAAHLAMMKACNGPLPTQSGQSVFAAIAEVVQLLKRDSTTDWTRVNIEALRQHLLDMDDVMMRAEMKARDIPGGAEFTVTGTGRAIGAIQRVALNHSRMLNADGVYRVTADSLANGARFTVTAADGSAKRAAQIRGLGFAGLFTEGDHHAAHHLAIARGENPHFEKPRE